ncbi:class I SAM-dependent methyltransferase [Marinobacter sp. ANT_B65]|uniref:class I SAM-dependent methyltransferase n=1 Tax=Marinobacter sp. ANT_B65 TaxID=2039467 RepID=UPI001D0D6E70|nr:class I SAM-dependent methyltransferase [Marinobacter sp. ANT_B65]
MTVAPYNKNAKKFFNQYQSLTFEQVHSDWLPWLDKTGGLALDVGAGNGSDALALAERGWNLVAVEPASELRRKRHGQISLNAWMSGGKRQCIGRLWYYNTERFNMGPKDRQDTAH